LEYSDGRIITAGESEQEVCALDSLARLLTFALEDDAVLQAQITYRLERLTRTSRRGFLKALAAPVLWHLLSPQLGPLAEMAGERIFRGAEPKLDLGGSEKAWLAMQGLTQRPQAYEKVEVGNTTYTTFPVPRLAPEVWQNDAYCAMRDWAVERERSFRQRVNYTRPVDPGYAFWERMQSIAVTLVCRQEGRGRSTRRSIRIAAEMLRHASPEVERLIEFHWWVNRITSEVEAEMERLLTRDTPHADNMPQAGRSVASQDNEPMAAKTAIVRCPLAFLYEGSYPFDYAKAMQMYRAMVKPKPLALPAPASAAPRLARGPRREVAAWRDAEGLLP
jgi:hypothetical protein